jgi:cytochrome c oxidase subunit 2
LQATALARQADWYLRSQLQAYRAGWRGSHPDDTLGQQMRAATAALPDERSILDVVAYIVTLR